MPQSPRSTSAVTTLPQFSIVIPAFNAEDTIARALDSVLAQEIGDFEIIAVDDGSTDATPEILIAYAQTDERIKLVSKENGGTASALNAGVIASCGRFIIQLGADDELADDCLAQITECMDTRPGFDIYAFNAYRVLPNGSRTIYHHEPRYLGSFSLKLTDLIEKPSIYGAAAFRRELFSKVGGFDESTYNEDYDFWLRALARGATHVYCPYPLALYHVREGQKSSDGIRGRESDREILMRLIGSRMLSKSEEAIARERVADLERNIATRKRLQKLLGPRVSQSVITFARKVRDLLGASEVSS